MRIITKNQDLLVIRDIEFVAYFIGISFPIIGLLSIYDSIHHIFIDTAPIWLDLLFIGSGLFALFYAKSTVISLDKLKGQAVFQWKTIAHIKTKVYALESFKKIELHELYRPAEGQNHSNPYVLVFISGTGEEIPLNPQGNYLIIIMVIFTIYISNTKKIGTEIANFLEIPFEEFKQPSWGSLISDIISYIKKTFSK